MRSIHLVLTMVALGCTTGPSSAEPDYCKRGMWLSDAYRHCFEQQRINLPYLPLQQLTPVVDGCMVEDYARHVCQVVKPAALSCFEGEVRSCDHKDRLLAIADQSGGACSGNQVNKEFKEHILNFLQPVRTDSRCFSLLGEDAYQCWVEETMTMMEENPNLETMSVDEFIVANNQFFDRLLTCFVDVFRSNVAACENWQIPLLMELQGTGIPSLFGMTFTPEQMDRLELVQECPTHHGGQPYRRHCNNQPTSTPSDDKGEDEGQVQQQQQLDFTLPPFLKPKA